jgi:hypothetical protein
VATLGNSAGGLPAVRAGIELGARRVVAFGARIRDDRSDSPDEGGREVLDAIVRLMTDAPHLPEIACVFGGDNQRDRQAAQALPCSPRLRLLSITGLQRHNPMAELIRLGLLAPVLAWLTGAAERLPSFEPGRATAETGPTGSTSH